jgi:hypothetical protein
MMGLYVCAPTAVAAEDKSIPPIPANCANGVADKGYCTEAVIPPGGFPISIRFFVVVEKENYPTGEDLLTKYLAFDQWPAYAESTGSDNLIFNRSLRMQDKVDGQGQVLMRQYFDYKLKSPIGYQKIRGITHNQRMIKPYRGAESTTEFVVQTSGVQEVPAGEKPLNGAEGLKLQTGSLNLVSCEGTGLCSDQQWIVIYESTITPAINLLPKVVASSVEKGIADVIVGMLFN